MVSIYSMTIVIRSVYKTCCERFYSQIHLANGIYKTCQNTIELIFLKVSISKCKETSREYSLCKFYYFLDKSFSYGPYLCNGCYDMFLKVISMQN